MITELHLYLVSILFWSLTFCIHSLSILIPFFKPGACSRRPRAPGFLKLIWSHVGMCVYVSVCLCVHPWTGFITNGVILCDIGHIWLVKQVSRLFPAFNYFIWHLPSIKMDGHGHINTACRECMLKKTKVMWYYVGTKGLPERWSASFIKWVGKCLVTHLKDGQLSASQ